MKKYLFILFITSNHFSFSQTYTIPGATEQPAWVFPLWFEDGAGNKDTLYFGYDPDAQDFGWPQSDSIFGEELINIDTSIFNTLWESGFAIPEAIKVVIWKDLENSSVFSFYKTYYPPLILRWDKNLFYSDALPFPDQTPAPKAWGEIITEGDMTPAGCSFQYPFIMTYTTDESGLACYKEDSMIFINGSLSGLIFVLKAWEPTWSGLNNISDEKNIISIYPNPLKTNFCFLNTNFIDELILKIYSSEGILIYKTTLTGTKSYTLHLPELLPGMYFIQTLQNNFSQTLKLIKS